MPDPPAEASLPSRRPRTDLSGGHRRHLSRSATVRSSL